MRLRIKQFKHKKNLRKILLTSIGLSLFGFILDSGEMEPSILQNAKDIVLMTTVFFGFGLLLYFLITRIYKLIDQNNRVLVFHSSEICSSYPLKCEVGQVLIGDRPV